MLGFNYFFSLLTSEDVSAGRGPTLDLSTLMSASEVTSSWRKLLCEDWHFLDVCVAVSLQPQQVCQAIVTSLGCITGATDFLLALVSSLGN